MARYEVTMTVKGPFYWLIEDQTTLLYSDNLDYVKGYVQARRELYAPCETIYEVFDNVIFDWLEV